MSQCATFGTDLDALGIWWPRGDGSSLRSIADGWRVIAEYVDEMAAALNGGASRMLEDYQGPAADAFGALWAEWSSDPGYLPQTAADCRQLCHALIDFSEDIDAADRTIVQLIELALHGQVVNSPAAHTTSSATPGPTGPASTNPGLTDLDPEWIVWLHEQAASIAAALANRADQCGQRLHDAGHQNPRLPQVVPGHPPEAGPGATAGGPSFVCPSTEMPVNPSMAAPTSIGTLPPGGDRSRRDDDLNPDIPLTDDAGHLMPSGRSPIDLAPVDPDAIEWVDPGTPTDLTHLGIEPVDFGAGPGGCLPIGPLVPGSSESDRDPEHPPKQVDCGPPINQPGVDAPPLDPPEIDSEDFEPPEIESSDFESSDFEPPEIESSDFELADLEAPEIDPGDFESPEIPSAPAFSGLSSSAPPVFVPPPIDAVSELDLADFELADFELAASGAPTDAVLPLASLGQPVAGPPAAVPEASSGGSGRTGRMPFPMLPMGAGGAATDDGQEPKRKRMRQ